MVFWRFVPLIDPPSPANGMGRLHRREAVKQTEIARVVDGSLVKVNLCARDNERSIYRGIGVYVRIAQLDLISSYGSILVIAWIGELGACSVWDVNNSCSDAR